MLILSAGHSLAQDFVVIGISVQEFQDLHQTLDVPETKAREKTGSSMQTCAIGPADWARNSWIYERELVWDIWVKALPRAEESRSS